MASYTPNYHLKKPADAESYDINDANGNMDIIDEELNTLNGNLTTLQSRTAATTATSIETTGTDVLLPGNVGFVFFVMPRTASIAWHYILSYTKQNGTVNIRWITDEPSGVTVVAGVNKITVSHSQTNGFYAFTMMASW